MHHSLFAFRSAMFHSVHTFHTIVALYAHTNPFDSDGMFYVLSYVLNTIHIPSYMRVSTRDEVFLAFLLFSLCRCHTLLFEFLSLFAPSWIAWAG